LSACHAFTSKAAGCRALMRLHEKVMAAKEVEEGELASDDEAGQSVPRSRCYKTVSAKCFFLLKATTLYLGGIRSHYP
jgi:hypothetical protein